MKSPFPGMDPYIEAHGLWEDFHDDLIAEIKRSLAQAAPERYLVRTGKRSYLVLVEEEGKKDHAFVPDVRIETTESRKKPSRRKGHGTALAETEASFEVMRMRIFIEEEHREAFVEIYEATAEQRLVTCIEVLSASNKRPKTVGREEYLRKRQSVVLGEVNLVEIDLLRGGMRMPMLDPWPDSPFTLLVSRPSRKPDCEVWPAFCHHKLPTVPVPLSHPDPDLSLNLQPMIDAVYQRSRYGNTIDYSKPLTPPLSSEERACLSQKAPARRR